MNLLAIVRLLDEKEELGSAYADAGLEAQMTALRSDPAILLSVEAFLYAVETLNSHTNCHAVRTRHGNSYRISGRPTPPVKGIGS